MADLLRTGHTMLNIACPICNNPIFKNREGKKFCPSCNREVIVSNSIPAQKFEESEEKLKNVQDIKDSSNKEVENLIRIVIVKKIHFILEKLETATETELIKNYSNILSGLYDLLKKLM
ncbi:MAG: Sjogren's syndrome/scleroderma autoantigen 1 family protein [Promethearchaeota archaeon]